MNGTKSSLKFCSSNFLYNILQSNRENCLLFDIRSNSQRKNGMILSSIRIKTTNLSQNKEVLEKTSDIELQKASSDLLDLVEDSPSEKELKKLKSRRRYFCFLLISDDVVHPELLENPELETIEKDIVELADEDIRQVSESDRTSVLNGIEMFRQLQSEKIRELYILGEGVKYFLQKYPFMSLQQLEAAKKEPPRYPNEIIKRVFLGNLNQVKNKDILKDLRITHVLNTAQEVEVDSQQLVTIGIQYFKLPIGDYVDFDISKFFQEAYEIIASTLTKEQDTRILVHCALGRSRSVAIVIMYLMHRHKWSFEKAYDYVQTKKDNINVNLGFKEFLEEFEKKEFQFVS